MTKKRRQPTPEESAALAVTVLDCPACGCQPSQSKIPGLTGCVFRCTGCGSLAIGEGNRWRDGATAWNRWVSNARKIDDRSR